MGEVKTLVKNGRWIVPVEERPKDWRKILPDPEAPPEPEIAVAAEGPTPATCKPRQDTWWGWNTLKRAIERSAREHDFRGADAVEAGMILAAGMWCRDHKILAKRIPGKNTALFAERCVSLELWKDEGLVELGDFDIAGDLDFWLRAGAIAGLWMLVRENGRTLFKSVGA